MQKTIKGNLSVFGKVALLNHFYTFIHFGGITPYLKSDVNNI